MESQTKNLEFRNTEDFHPWTFDIFIVWVIPLTSILWKSSASIIVICSAISPDLKCSKSDGLKIYSQVKVRPFLGFLSKLAYLVLLASYEPIVRKYIFLVCDYTKLNSAGSATENSKILKNMGWAIIDIDVDKYLRCQSVCTDVQSDMHVGFSHESRPEIIKLFSCSTQLGTKFILLINVKCQQLLAF